jgi:hypothetical protein
MLFREGIPAIALARPGRNRVQIAAGFCFQARRRVQVAVGMQLTSRQLPVIILVLFPAAITGCRSDPYCQQAISNLRSEKIQLENQYFALKNQYESDMRRLGEPPPATPAPAIPASPVLPSGDGVIEESVPPLGSNFPSAPGQPPVNRGIIGNGLRAAKGGDVSRYIQSVEVNQMPGRPGSGTRLLVRPLDERGEVIPVAGDLHVVLVDAGTGTAVASYQFDRSQVENLVEDRANAVPGIHLGLPQLASPSAGQQLICQLQYRTATNNVLSAQTGLVAGGGENPAITVSSKNTPRKTSPAGMAAISDTPQIADVFVEIGDEMNLDSLPSASGSGPSRPVWSPGR